MQFLQLPLFNYLKIAAIVSAPFDVVKTHRQIEFGEKISSLPRAGTFAILSRIFRENGVRGLYAGIVPRLIKIVPGCAIMITSFEYSKAFFFKHNVEQFAAIS